jgi:hypothetical protein
MQARHGFLDHYPALPSERPDELQATVHFDLRALPTNLRAIAPPGGRGLFQPTLPVATRNRGRLPLGSGPGFQAPSTPRFAQSTGTSVRKCRSERNVLQTISSLLSTAPACSRTEMRRKVRSYGWRRTSRSRSCGNKARGATSPPRAPSSRCRVLSRWDIFCPWSAADGPSLWSWHGAHQFTSG